MFIRQAVAQVFGLARRLPSRSSARSASPLTCFHRFPPSLSRQSSQGIRRVIAPFTRDWRSRLTRGPCRPLPRPPRLQPVRWLSEGSASATAPRYSDRWKKIEGVTWLLAFAVVGYKFTEFLLEFPEPCPDAVRLAESHGAVIKVLGAPLRPSLFWSGSVRNQSCNARIPVKGPRGEGTLILRAVQSDPPESKWHILYLDLELPETREEETGSSSEGGTPSGGEGGDTGKEKRPAFRRVLQRIAVVGPPVNRSMIAQTQHNPHVRPGEELARVKALDKKDTEERKASSTP